MSLHSLTTDRLRRLLVEIRRQHLPVEVDLASDILGPGGGVYVKAGTPVTTRHITWVETRNPASKTHPTFIDIQLRRTDPGDVDDLPLKLGAHDDVGSSRKAARAAADAVGRQARDTARVVRSLHERLRQRKTQTRMSAPELAASFDEFDREYRRLRQVVRVAVDEFLGGNTLAMDFIADHDLERVEVRHAMRVATLATELRVRAHGDRLDDDAFRRSLVDLFVAGFLHDGGMWDEPFCFARDHETRGASLAHSALGEAALTVEKLILFHSDWEALVGSSAVGFVRLSDGPLYERRTGEASSLRADSDLLLLSDDERGGALALALAERWTSASDDTVVRVRGHRSEIDSLVNAVDGESGATYLAQLCNMDIESAAPRRAWVQLSGAVPVYEPRRGLSERLVRTPVDGYVAGSLGHGDDGASPHLVTLFAPGDSGREPLTSRTADDDDLWERRRAGRWYVPAGRYKNLLEWRVTGFLSPSEYESLLAPYEATARRRGLFNGTGGEE